jgi:hypothetical protein
MAAVLVRQAGRASAIHCDRAYDDALPGRVRDNRYELNCDNVCQHVRRARRDGLRWGSADQMFVNCVKALLGLGGGGREEAITSAHAVMPLCGVHYTAAFFIDFAIIMTGMTLNLACACRSRRFLLALCAVRVVVCSRQSRHEMVLVNVLDGSPWVCMGIYRRRVGDSGK